jgi:hypothetical protein
LAIDFDGKEWQKDIAIIRKVCTEFTIPIAVERSRSGTVHMPGFSLSSLFRLQQPANLEALCSPMP